MTNQEEIKVSDWYLEIEEPVREIVKTLRDNGINTTCSCGHEMTIQVDLFLNGQLWDIHKVLSNHLAEKNLPINYDIEVHLVVKNGWLRQCFADISLKEVAVEPLIEQSPEG